MTFSYRHPDSFVILNFMKHGLIVIPLVVVFFFTSCCDTNKKSVETRDFSAHYFLDTVASLGTEVIIHYKNNRPVSSSILINEEKRSTLVQYLFIKDSILVSEEIFYYNDSLSIRKDILNEVFWIDDTDSVNFVRYIIDYNGAVIWKNDSLNEIKNHYSLIDSLL